MTHCNAVPNRRAQSLLCALCIGLSLNAGCFKTRNVLAADTTDGGADEGADKDDNRGDAEEADGGDAQSAGAAGMMASGNFGNAGDAGLINPFFNSMYVQPSGVAAICGAHSTCQLVQQGVDDVDLLFVIDNSNSMQEEQARLVAQFDRLIRILKTGDRSDGSPRFAPVADLHVGVVSSDMGLPGIPDVAPCDGLGDDGILRQGTAPGAPNTCHEDYPPFLSFNAAMPMADTTAQDLACIAPLGTGGCGFEQPLEAALKALWPSVDPSPLPDGSNRITFLGIEGAGTLGHGDDMQNGGFLRNDPSEGRSLIAVVVLSDEDDGSSSDMHHYTPVSQLDPNDPIYAQPLNLRNFYNKDELYPITRYINGLQALRPEDERLVIFGAITGVPLALVNDPQAQAVGHSEMQREAFYDTVLDDPAMQETPEPTTMTTPESGNLMPSCLTTDASGVVNGKAFPPQRLVQVARGFGANGFVHSICQDDYRPAIDALIDRVAARTGTGCVDRPFARKDDGLVDCDVLWELPEPGFEPAGSPTSCDQDGWALTPAGAEYAMSGLPANRLCKVTQLPVLEVAVVPDSSTLAMIGWYYDDFSPDADICGPGQGRIAFLNRSGARDVPTGMRAILDCN